MKDPLVTQEMVRRMARRRRRWRRIRRGLLVVCAAGVAVGLGYGIDRLAIVGHRLYVEDVEHDNGIPPVTAPPSTTATTTTTPGPPACTASQLNASLSHWQIADDTLYEIIVLTDTSGVPCTLTGYPGLGASGSDGAALPGPVSDVATLGSVTGAGAFPPVALGPGTQAWFEVSYSVACSVVLPPGVPATGTSDQCYAGADLQVVAPRATSALLVPQPLRFTYGTAGFQVGPFQGGALPLSPPLG